MRGILSLLDSFQQRKNFKQSLGEGLPRYQPKLTVIVPCKGEDQGFEHNALSILTQDYDDFEIIFVTDTPEDQAYQNLSGLLAARKYPHTKLVTAGVAQRRSQKIHNLLRAVAESRKESDVLVFADSDIRASKHWLSSLVQPLQLKEVGASTGYRWYHPIDGDFWSGVRSVWNMTSANVLFSERYNFAWGGSTAIRKELYEQLGLQDKWQTGLSDDMILTQTVKEAGFRIRFVPKSIVTSLEKTDFCSLLEWMARQLKIVRIYDPQLWALAAYPHWLFTGIFTLGLMVAVSGLVFDRTIPWPAYLMLSDLPAGALVNLIRFKSFKKVLRQEGSKPKTWIYASLHVVASYVMSIALIRSAIGRQITWRGIVYEMRSRDETIVLNSN